MPIIVFIFGLLVGSFLNAIIYRLNTGESIAKGRSHCPKCGHSLSWYELLPVISFIIQRARCRSCKEGISWQYPIVEIVTASMFLLIFNEFLISGYLSVVYYLVILSLMIIIFVFDLKHYIIPDKILYPAVVIAFLYQVFVNLSSFGISSGGMGALSNPILSALLAPIFFLIIFLFSRGRAMGFGDVKLAFFMGMFLGWPAILVALFIAFITGGIMGLGLISFGKRTLKSQVPFGPFLILGTFASLFWGRNIWEWYVGLLIL